MNKKILLTLAVVLIVALSMGSIYAGEVDVADSYAAADDASLEVSQDQSQEAYDSNVDNVLESENSNSLSTNNDESNVLTSDNNASSDIDVSKTVTSKDVTKYYKGSAKYTATFLDNEGKALANTNVKISVNGKTQTVKTNGNGVASLAINLKPGNYKVVATNPTTGYSLTNNFKILSTITANDVRKVYTDGTRFYATFLKNNGKALANKNIKFKLNGRTYNVKTNSKGVASLSLTNLKAGTHKIISYNRDGLTKVNNVKVYRYTTTSLKAYDYTFLKSDTKIIKVKLLDKFGHAPSKGKTVRFGIAGKVYTATTNKYGVAYIKLPSIKEGIYNAAYKFTGTGLYKASATKSKITILPTKTPTFTVKSTTTFGYGAGTQFKVALTSGKVPLAGKTVTLKVDGKTYTKTTDSRGIVSLPIDLEIGKYTLSYTNKADSKVNSKTQSCQITVKQRTNSTIKWESSTSLYQGTQNVKVLLVDSDNKGISGVTVKLTDNSKTYSATTSSSGYATISAKLSAGNYNVTYNFGGDNDNMPVSGSVALTVVKPPTVSVKNVLAASTNLKNYYDKNGKFPATIAVGELSFTMPEFLYIMSQAISQLSTSNTKDIKYIDGVKEPSSPSGDNINSKQLYEAKYVAVAKSIVSYISTNKMAPNYASSAVGKIIYSEVLDSFSRILAFYNTNKRMPSYVVITYPSSGSAQSGTGLNEANTATNLGIYLISTKNCQVDHANIKNVVNTITKGLTTDKQKATAIFKYVRDTLDYSFYYNTKYGAVNTLSVKKGNCVDHSHLLVAMFRTADIPARYVHGTCTFSSGSTYGHVWTQVLIDGKWYVADATSSKNSIGSVANWNTKTFRLSGIYNEITF